jgi:hypothetical protein
VRQEPVPSILPGWMRHDQERATSIARQQNRASQETLGPDSWDTSLAAMQERVDNQAELVDFSVKPYPQPRYNLLGQSMPRERRWG